MLFLFTDFGSADLYVGQVRAVLHESAPDAAVVDLLNDAPGFQVRASAHLLAALTPRLPRGSVVLAVVDPGVGGVREAVVVEADGLYFVGPDNGLLSVVTGRAETVRCWRITWRPTALSVSFHGRDLFAPVAAAVARGDFPDGWGEPLPRLGVALDAGDLAEIIYIDHYGNAQSGLRATAQSHETRFECAGHTLAFARVFAEVPPGTAFWYENSLGLVEIAVNGASAEQHLGLRVGDSLRALP